MGVTSTSSDAVYGVGSTIPILVTFNEDVVVTGVPTLALETGTTDATVNYDATATAAYHALNSVTDKKSIIFTYTVANTHTTTDLDYKATTSLVTPSGVTIRDNLLTDATLTLATPGASNSGSLSNAETLYIDGVRPAASSTAATAGTKTIVITMSEPVGGTIANSTKDFSVLVNSTNNVVTGVAVSGSTVTLTVTDVIPNSATVTWQYAQDADELITGTASASNAANSLLSVTTNQAVTLTNDVSAPTVSSVALASGVSGVKKIGDVIPIEISFNEVVVVAGGSPTLELETGTTDATATYASGSGTNKLTFNYTVANTHVTSDLNYKATTSLVNPAGVTIRDNLGTDATLTLAATTDGSNALGSAQNLEIDGVIPTVSGYAATAGTNVITLTMSENIISSATASTLAGDFTVLVNTVAKTVSSVAPANGDSATTSLALTMAEAIPNDATVTVAYAQDSSNSINGSNGGNLVASISSPQNVTVTNDNTRPTITDVSGPNGTYSDGDVVALNVLFSEVVVVTGGNATISLETGSTDGTATYASGSGSNTLIFNYTVGAGETSSDLDYKATTSFNYIAQNASVKDNAGNLAILTLPAPGDSNTGSLAHNDAIIIA